MIDFEAVLRSHENVKLEVMAAQGGLPEGLWKTYSSFANTDGGTIILGIGLDKGTGRFIPLGITEPTQLISDIWKTVNDAAKVSFNILSQENVYIQDYEDKHYVILEVPRASRRSRPIYIGEDPFKGTYKRYYHGDYHCRKEVIMTMIAEKG